MSSRTGLAQAQELVADLQHAAGGAGVAYLPQAGRLGACASLANLLNRLRPGLRVM